MLSELLSISKKLDIPEITGLDKRCLQITFFLLLNIDKEFTHNRLLRQLNKKHLYFSEPTFTRHLNHLEEREIIIRTRNHTTTISLNVNTIEQKMKIKNAIQFTKDKLNEIKNIDEELSSLDLFNEVKQCYMEKASSSFLLKLRYINKQIPESEFYIGYLWTNQLYELISDVYIEEIKKRGDETITEILNMYYKDGKN